MSRCATIGKKLLIIWDRLQAHRSKLVRQHVENQRGAIALEFLPAYAPELSPTECIWGHPAINWCPPMGTRTEGQAWQEGASMYEPATSWSHALHAGAASACVHFP